MGLYSSIKPVNEMAEFDKMLESYTPDESCNLNHLMEFMIQIDENDHQLFNSLIECDFLSAANNAVLTEAEAEEVDAKTSEVKKNKIWEKIKEILTKFKNIIIKLTQDIIAKIIQLVKGDQKLYEMYKNVITVANLKDWEGITNFAWPHLVTGDNTLTDFKQVVSKFVDGIKGQSSRENIDAAFDEYQDASERLAKEIDAKIGFGFDKEVEKFKPDESQIKEMTSVVKDAKEIIDNIKKTSKGILDQVKNLEAYAKAVLKSKQQRAELEVYAANKMSAVVSGSAKTLSKLFNDYMNTAKKQISAYRKAFILCGRAATKASNANAKEVGTALSVANNESVEWLLAESSDDYVFECLAY